MRTEVPYELDRGRHDQPELAAAGGHRSAARGGAYEARGEQAAREAVEVQGPAMLTEALDHASEGSSRAQAHERDEAALGSRIGVREDIDAPEPTQQDECRAPGADPGKLDEPR